MKKKAKKTTQTQGKPVLSPPEIKQQRSCFFCDGSGQMCNICGEADGACECDDYDMRDCDDCGGNGIASADQEKK